MNIRTEAKINIIFGKYINYMPFWFKFIACLALFRAINLIAFDSLVFSFPVTYISTLTKLFVLILVLFLIPIIIYSIFKKFFSKINFEYNHFLLCHLLLKEHHSSSNLNLELNKLKEAIENESQLYNDLNKLDFPYINKFISRYYRYNNYKEKQNNNNKKIYNTDLDKLNISNPQLLSMDNMDNELNNLINNQFKNLNNEKQFNVIKTIKELNTTGN
jgi:hypothetical protein